ncbi:Uncharacterized protein dnm_017690 [Desulfonema magnum]|uniref:Uncharacterized protein n=1 Tax=Desulfonema magnum TaxID=45655 RepID=A0A975GLM5_9BACT|nr:Uncharacterized protein dnm_017690 [Desulfonema magnum]
MRGGQIAFNGVSGLSSSRVVHPASFFFLPDGVGKPIYIRLRLPVAACSLFPYKDFI